MLSAKLQGRISGTSSVPCMASAGAVAPTTTAGVTPLSARPRALKKSDPKGKGSDGNSRNVRSASMEEVDEAEERAANERDALLIRQKELETQLTELRAKAGFQ